jgi:hypothetical protein
MMKKRIEVKADIAVSISGHFRTRMVLRRVVITAAQPVARWNYYSYEVGVMKRESSLLMCLAD